MRKRLMIALLLVIFKSYSFAQIPIGIYNLLNMEIKNRLDSKLNSNVVIAVVDSKTTQYFVFSSKGEKSKPELGINSIFRADQVFDLLQDFYYSELITKSSIDFNLPIQDYLPKTSKVVTKISKKITLTDLLLNTSGLSCEMNIDSVDQINKLLENCRIDYPTGSFYEKNILVDRFNRNILETISGIKEYESIHNTILSLKLDHTIVSIPQNNQSRESQEAMISISIKDLSKILLVEMGILDKQSQIGLVKLREFQRQSVIKNSYYTTSWIKVNIQGVELYVSEFQQFNNHLIIAFDPLKKVGVVAISDITPIHEIVFSVLTQTQINSQIETPDFKEEILNVTGEYYNDLLEVVSIFKKNDRMYAYLGKTGVYELFYSGLNKYYTIIPDLDLSFKLNPETNEQILVIQNHQEYRKK